MPESLGKIVKEMRLARKLTQGQVEALTGGRIKRSWLSRLEDGQYKLSSPTLLQPLAEVLHTTVAELYDRAGIIDIPTDLPPEDKEVLDLIHRMSGATRRIAIGVLRQLNGADSVITTEEEDTARAQKKAT